MHNFEGKVLLCGLRVLVNLATAERNGILGIACVKASLPPLQKGKALFEILPSALKLQKQIGKVYYRRGEVEHAIADAAGVD